MITYNQKFTYTPKTLLLTLPFLTPIIPPMGISCLKSYLCEHGIKNVKTIDCMADLELKIHCYNYFETLKNYITPEKRGFFFNVGLDVLSNQFMAHINYIDESKYKELVRLLVYNNFYVNLNENEIESLIEIVNDFFNTLENYIIDLIEDEKPDVLGLSIYKGTLAASLFTSKIVKQRYPHIRIVAGGTIFSQELFPYTPNFTLFMEKAVWIDSIFIGEGEILVLKYLKGELPEKRIYTINDINNEILDLNLNKLPDYSDFDLSEYPLLPMYTSRGCIYKCNFCAETVYWKKYNSKNVSNIIREFEELYYLYKKNVFILTDCLINPLATSLAEELIRQEKEFYWDVYLKVDKQTCDSETTKLWRRGGFYRARLGIESGSQNVLNLIGKGITIQQIKDSLKNLASLGIKTTTYWIAGYPGETEEDFNKTLDLIQELQEYIYEAECDPFRYFYSGQVKSDQWLDIGNQLLYPEEMADMLITQTWQLNAEPSREKIFERACRFKEHCNKLGIPNPYSLSEIYKADERWYDLHKNAVPSLMSLLKK